jgi:cation transport ATPase
MNDDLRTRPVTPAQRFFRRLAAVLTMVVLIAAGLLFAFLAVTTGGKGEQVAPVMTAMVAVMFGFPMVAVLARNVRTVWQETA